MPGLGFSNAPDGNGRNEASPAPYHRCGQTATLWRNLSIRPGFASPAPEHARWRFRGWDFLIEDAQYALSVVLPLLGSPVTKVVADLRNVKDAGDAEDHVHMVLTTESGITADVVVSTAMAFQAPKWMVFGKYGGLSSDGVKSSIKYYDPSAVPEISPEDGPAPERKYRSETLPWVIEELLVEAEGVPSFHEDVYRVLTRGGLPMVTAESALEVVRVTELAAISAEKRSPKQTRTAR